MVNASDVRLDSPRALDTGRAGPTLHPDQRVNSAALTWVSPVFAGRLALGSRPTDCSQAGPGAQVRFTHSRYAWRTWQSGRHEALSAMTAGTATVFSLPRLVAAGIRDERFERECRRNVRWAPGGVIEAAGRHRSP